MDEQLGALVLVLFGLLVGASLVTGWYARGWYDDREFARVTARMCEAGIACFGDRG